MRAPLRVALAFASRGIGGAERSMLRLMGSAHPDPFECRVFVLAPENTAFRKAVLARGVPYHGLAPLDAIGWQRLLRAHRPDVLYVFGRFRTVCWAALARLAGIDCIVAAERSSADRWSDGAARRLDRGLVTAYVANTEFAAQNLRGILGREGPPVFVVVNGIERTTFPEGQGGFVHEPSILCVGNITRNKGQGVLLEAVRLLRASHKGLRATLVGRDFTGGGFFREAERRGLDDFFTAEGFVDDTRRYLARATVAVLPTLHREGMPTSVLEAMAAGVPVVASRVGGVTEIVEEGTTGLLVTPGDARELAGAIGRLLGDPAERSRLAGNARRYVRERHDLANMVEGHRRAFEEALARAGRREGKGRPVRREAPALVAHVTTAAISLRYLLMGQLLAIRERGYAVTGVSSAGSDASALEERAIPHRVVPMTRRFTPLRDLASLVRLYFLMRRGGFTIVHTHNPKPGLLAQLAARLAGVPVVVNTLHGFYFHEGMAPAWRRFYVTLEKIAARCSDVILSQNEEDIETAVREGIAPRDRIRYLGNGIDLSRFDPARLSSDTRRRTRASLGIAEDAPVVGFVGRLVAEKGVGELFLAARQVLACVPAARFLFVGGTDAEKPDHVTPEAADALGLGRASVFAGVRQDMPELYRSMDLLVLPSHREGFPRAPLEASAMRVPCVATDIRGCRQAVSHGRTGLLVPVGDASALAEAILTLLFDRALAERLGEEGRRRALREFDEQRVFATVLSEYERLLFAKGLSERIPPLTEPLSSAAGR